MKKIHSMKNGIQMLYCILLILVFISASTMDVLANDLSSSEDTKVLTEVIITNSETGEKWTWELDENSTLVNKELRSYSNYRNSNTTSQAVTVDVKPLLDEVVRASYPSQSKTQTGDIKITAGLTYSAYPSNNTVRLRNVFGSTTNKGNYYASNRKVIYSNPALYGQKVFYPSSSSWNKALNEGAGQYISDLPPFTTASCRVNITGMSAYTTIDVVLKLDL